MPSVRQGPVLQSPDVKHPHYGDRTILEWPEEGRQLAMGGEAELSMTGVWSRLPSSFGS